MAYSDIDEDAYTDVVAPVAVYVSQLDTFGDGICSVWYNVRDIAENLPFQHSPSYNHFNSPVFKPVLINGNITFVNGLSVTPALNESL